MFEAYFVNRSHLRYRFLFNILFGIKKFNNVYFFLNIRVIRSHLLLCYLDINTGVLKFYKKARSIWFTFIYLAPVIIKVRFSDLQQQHHLETWNKHKLSITVQSYWVWSVEPAPSLPKDSDNSGLFSNMSQWILLLFKPVVIKHSCILEWSVEFLKNLNSQAALY